MDSNLTFQKCQQIKVRYLIHYEDDTKISRGTYFLLNGEMSKHDGLSQEKLLARISSK